MHGFDEEQRLAVVQSLELLGSPPEPEFETIVNGAKQMFGCKSAFISLIAADRQWFLARCNLDTRETARDVSFCTRTVEADEPLIIPDTHADPRFAANPLVLGPPFIRFYAGVPLHARDGADGAVLPVGTLCVIDDVPHQPHPAKIRMLKDMAVVAEALLELRRTSRESLRLALERHDTLLACERVRTQLAQAERMANIGSWRLDLVTEQVSWSDQTYAIHALDAGEGTDLSTALDFYTPSDRARIAGAVAACAEHGHAYDLELDFVDAGGVRKRVRAMGEAEVAEGRPVAIVGVIQDITERHRLEQSLRESAHTDELTRIASRRAFNEMLDTAIADASDGGEPVAVALLDLDRFKEVNDRLGHAAGDEVLRRAADTLRAADYLGHHVAARLGGDEFVLLLRGAAAGEALPEAIARLLRELRQTVRGAGAAIPVSATVGASRLAPGLGNRSALLKAADQALYRAKQVRRGTGAVDGRAGLIAASAGPEALARVA